MDEPRSNIGEYTVSEIAQAVRRTIEDDFGYVRVRGEISGFRGVHSSGHAYFSLKDEGAALDAVIWKTSFARLRFKPEEGLEVIVTGRLTTFPRSSKYQIVIEQLEPAGAGALMALLEERRRKLQAEGLFDASRKKKIPYLPRVIGVVTSPTGAVIRDILHRLGDRFPSHVLVWPVRVQGETSAAEVSAAVSGFNDLPADGPIPRPDLIIVARGGGSIEDLWSFNEEIVVRAVAESRIPVISAVGHETDTTLCDYAADMRAPTPTAAAEAAVPVRVELIGYVEDLGQRKRHGLRRELAAVRDLRGRRQGLRCRARSTCSPLPASASISRRPGSVRRSAPSSTARRSLSPPSRRACPPARCASRCCVKGGCSPRRRGGSIRRCCVSSSIAGANGKSRSAASRPSCRAGSPSSATGSKRRVNLLESLGYRGVLARGYAVVTDVDGNLIRSAQLVASGQPIGIEFTDGSVAAHVDSEYKLPPLRQRRKRSKPPEDDKGQQSLF